MRFIERINQIKNVVLVFTLFISVSVIIGWIFGIRRILNVIPEGATMKFNTAFLFLLLSIGLLVSQKEIKHYRLINSSIVFVILFIGGVTLAQYYFNFSSFIDSLFITDTFSQEFAGRMSQATAFCFVLMGVGLLGIDSKSLVIRKIIQYVLLVVTSVSWVAIVAYILQIPEGNKIFWLNSMAIHTSVLFFMLSYAFSLKNPTLGFTGLVTGIYGGSKLMRLLLPYVVVLPMVLSCLLLSIYNNFQIESDFGIAIYTVVFTLISIVYISIISLGLNKSDVKRKELETSLYSSNQELTYFKQALDDSSIVAITDSKDVIHYVNNKFCEISKFKREELIGQTHQLVNSGYHPEEFFKEIWQTISSGKVWVGEIKNKAKDGQLYWVYTSIVPFKNESGEIYQYLSIRQDITKKKEAEELLSSQYIPTLERKNKELENFVFIASHDLQEPLHSVSSLVDLLKTEYQDKLDETANEYLTFISKATTRMSDLIKGLLDYSRIGGKKHLEMVDCNDIMADIKADLASYIARTNTTITIGKLPKIKAYKTELRLLFQNLINNAIKFSKKDVLPEVHISAQRKGEHWRFAVKDNGIGIAEEDKHKIFAIFQRLHSRKEYEGTGIGLSHCQKIVQLFGGGIWVESQPNEGSIFYFTIPINIT
ncbi:ATP-binding protein [Reichenbachiella sp. MALMAid0571]|uniref:PAS domain-containing sensor histidine kinase n=1 Tax=Reichenbachiella sp. MALMAid0571 TaxID=3143939 RepID=UPI0032DF9A54